MKDQQSFPLEQVFSITHRVLLTKHVTTIPDRLTWFRGRRTPTDQWPAAAAEVTPLIVAQHPFLAQISLTPVNPLNDQEAVRKTETGMGKRFYWSDPLTRSKSGCK